MSPERPGEAGNGDDPEGAERKRQSAAYQGASEAVFAIAIGTGVGWWIDGQLDSRPVGLLVGATIGFAAFVLRLIRLGRAMNESPADSSPSDGSAPQSNQSDKQP